MGLGGVKAPVDSALLPPLPLSRPHPDAPSWFKMAAKFRERQEALTQTQARKHSCAQFSRVLEAKVTLSHCTSDRCNIDPCGAVQRVGHLVGEQDSSLLDVSLTLHSLSLEATQVYTQM